MFFRDDHNLPFLPSEPPATIFTSFSPYGLSIDFPDSNATNVPLNTNFTMMTTRPAGIVALSLSPETKIANLTKETRQWSGYYTFQLAELLQPNTTYTATVLYGQSIPADFDSAPLSIETWSFTTGESILTQSPSTSPTVSPTTEPIYPITIILVIITIVIAVVLAAVLVLREKKQSAPPKVLP